MSPGAERIVEIAHHAYDDAVDLLACIGVLEAGNTPTVLVPLMSSEAAHALGLIQKALFLRLSITLERAYDSAPAWRPSHARWLRAA